MQRVLQPPGNPAWADAISQFQGAVVGPLLGDKTAIAETDWNAITNRFTEYENWQRGKAAQAWRCTASRLCPPYEGRDRR